MRNDIWRKQAESDLKIYESSKQALINIPDQIKELEERMTSIRSQTADSVSVKGGGGLRTGPGSAEDETGSHRVNPTPTTPPEGLRRPGRRREEVARMTEITLREQIKQKLHSYNSIRNEAADIVAQIEQIREVMESPRMAELDGMPHGSGGGTDPLAGLIDELRDLEAKYKDKIHRLHEAMAEVEDMVETESLDSTERRLLRYRYIKGLAWEEVCVKLGYSWSQTHRIHGAILDKLVEAEMKK